MSDDRVRAAVDGRTVLLGHLDKEWWPDGTTKRTGLEYYARIAPVMLPHLAGRPASFVRAPDGSAGQRWVAKHVPQGAPEWVPRAVVRGKDGDWEQVEVADTATLVWAANAGCVEVHVPQYRSGPGSEGEPGQEPEPAPHDRLVIDLDPGPGTTLVECCRVALEVRDRLAADGVGPAVPVVSGGKGLHVYAPWGHGGEEAVGAARTLARELAAAHPDAVTATMAKSARTGRVFLDWSQNRSAKTTCSPYSLRLGDRPAVAAPVTWDEAAACTDPADLRFGPEEVLERVARDGDLLRALGAGTAT